MRAAHCAERRAAARDPATCPDRLAALCMDRTVDVALAAWCNPSTATSDLLDALEMQQHLSVWADRHALAEVLAARDDLTSAELDEVAAMCDKVPEHRRDPDDDVDRQLACHPAADRPLLLALARRCHDVRVARLMLSHPRCDREIVGELAVAPAAAVREVARDDLRCPEAPRAVSLLMGDDTSSAQPHAPVGHRRA
jgi:hypothetical protein